MAISAIANAGMQPPTLASLLEINRINPLAARDSDDAGGVSGVALPKAGSKNPAAPKLVQDLLQTLNQMGANPEAGKSLGNSSQAGQAQDIKKSAMDFLTSVFSALKPQTSNDKATLASPIEQLSAGLSQMMGEISSGSLGQTQVIEAADQLFKSAGLATNASTLGGLLQSLQKSIMDESGITTGTMINTRA